MRLTLAGTSRTPIGMGKKTLARAGIVAKVIEGLGGPSKASGVAQVSNNTIYKWRTDNVVGLSAPCLRLAREYGKRYQCDPLYIAGLLAGLD